MIRHLIMDFPTARKHKTRNIRKSNDNHRPPTIVRKIVSNFVRHVVVKSTVNVSYRKTSGNDRYQLKWYGRVKKSWQTSFDDQESVKKEDREVEK